MINAILIDSSDPPYPTGDPCGVGVTGACVRMHNGLSISVENHPWLQCGDSCL